MAETLSPASLALIARMQAMPKEWRVVTTYDDGSTHVHETAMESQANNYAISERRRMGKPLINRETGKIATIISVTVEKI